MSRDEEIRRVRDELQRAKEIEQKCDRDYERTRSPGDAARADRYAQQRMKLQAELDRLLYPSSTQSYSPPLEQPVEPKQSAGKTCLGCTFWIAIVVIVFKYCFDA